MSFIAIIIWPLVVFAIASMAYLAYDDLLTYKREKTTDQDALIAKLSTKFYALEQEFSEMAVANKEVLKQSEDVKKIVQQHNLKQMFGPKV